MARERLTTVVLLALTFAIRAIRPDQPIVENYVGRQIPTAMVARHLERGGSFFRPELATGPFPNRFLVEPPIYGWAVATLRPAIGFELETTGRLVSAAATTLGAWGLLGLARRREGPLVGLLALASYAIFPVMVRYGRDFQPDALMLGCVLAGLRGWDEYEATGDPRWAAFGGFVLSTGLALKITVAWCLLPFFLIVRRWPKSLRIAASIAMLTPSLSWYALAWPELARPGSMASADNAGLWLDSFSIANWLRLSTYDSIARGLVVRSFTPIGFVLAGWGLLASGPVDRLWRGWAIGCGLAIVSMAAKWHHAYYWMAAAPLAAVGAARGLVSLGNRGFPGRAVAAGLGSCFLGLCVYQSSSTWQDPPLWASVAEAGREVAAILPRSDPGLLVATEALVFYSDRPGLRLEFDEAACRRAAGEWGVTPLEVGGAFALLEFYRNEANVGLVADSGRAPPGSRREAFRRAIRASPRYDVVIDRPDLLAARPRRIEANPGPGPTSLDSRHARQDPRAGDDPRLRPMEGGGAEDQRPDRL